MSKTTKSLCEIQRGFYHWFRSSAENAMDWFTTHLNPVPEMIAISTECSAYNRLYQSKIIQFLQDSIAERPIGTPSRKSKAKKFIEETRNDAKKWFDVNNEDFIDTCEAAGWTPRMALVMFSSVQQSGTVPRLLKTFQPSEKKKSHKRRPTASRFPSILCEIGL